MPTSRQVTYEEIEDEILPAITIHGERSTFNGVYCESEFVILFDGRTLIGEDARKYMAEWEDTPFEETE